MVNANLAAKANNFNLLRLVLASTVILAHSFPLVDGDNHRELAIRLWHGSQTFGGLAVYGFFIISGYLIAQSWSREPRLWPYLVKRIRRIYPGFLVASLVSCIVVASLGTNPDYWREFRILPFLAGMFTLQLPAVPDPFLGLPHEDVNGSMWTISYEMTCYLAVAALGLTSLLKRRYVVLGLALGAVALNVVQARGFEFPHSIFDSWLSHMMLAAHFFAGTTFYLFRDRIRFTRWGMIVAAVVLFVAMFRYASSMVLLPWLGGYLILGLGFAPALPGTEPIRRVDISYGTYLYGWPIQQLIVMHWRNIDPWLLFAIALPLALLAGRLSWELIEGPAMRWAGRAKPAEQVLELATAPSQIG
jgi:peptidoglycan/LPS O-acetylase OafA/YrhL